MENENGTKFGDLIEEHLLIAASLVEAAKAGNSTAASDAEKKWYENADEIAPFENSIIVLSKTICNLYLAKILLSTSFHN